MCYWFQTWNWIRVPDHKQLLCRSPQTREEVPVGGALPPPCGGTANCTKLHKYKSLLTHKKTLKNTVFQHPDPQISHKLTLPTGRFRLFVKDCKKKLHLPTLFKSNDENQKIKSGGTTLPLTTNIKRSINYTHKENKKGRERIVGLRSINKLAEEAAYVIQIELKLRSKRPKIKSWSLFFSSS